MPSRYIIPTTSFNDVDEKKWAIRHEDSDEKSRC
jgi:hypothetical protein